MSPIALLRADHDKLPLVSDVRLEFGDTRRLDQNEHPELVPRAEPSTRQLRYPFVFEHVFRNFQA